MEDGNIHIECSDVKSIFLYMGSKTPGCLIANEGETVNCADFKIDERLMDCFEEAIEYVKEKAEI